MALPLIPILQAIASYAGSKWLGEMNRKDYEPVTLPSLSKPIDTSMFDKQEQYIPGQVEASLRPVRKKALEGMAFTGMRYSPASMNTMIPIEMKGAEMANNMRSNLAGAKTQYLANATGKREDMENQLYLYNEQNKRANQAQNDALQNQLNSLAIGGLLQGGIGALGGAMGMKTPTGSGMNFGTGMQEFMNNQMGYPSSTEQAMYQLMMKMYGGGGNNLPMIFGGSKLGGGDD